MKNDVTAEKNDLGFGVTREMIEAGRHEIEIRWTDFVGDSGFLLWDEVMCAVFLAMMKACDQPITDTKKKPFDVNPEMISRASDWFETNIAWGLPVIYGRNEIEEKMKELLNESLNSSNLTKE